MNGDSKTKIKSWYYVLAMMLIVILVTLITQIEGISSFWIYLMQLVSGLLFYFYILWKVVGWATVPGEYHVEGYMLILLVPIILVAWGLTYLTHPSEFQTSSLEVIHSNLIVIASILTAIVGFVPHFDLGKSLKKHIILVSVTVILLSLMSLIMSAIGYDIPPFYLFIIYVEILLMIAIFRILYKRVK